MYDVALVAPVWSLSIKDGHREVLERLLRSHRAPVCQVRRAQVLLLAADRASNVEITARCVVSRATVLAWREYFETEDLARFGEVAKGRGAKSSILEEEMAEIVRLTTQTTPEDVAATRRAAAARIRTDDRLVVRPARAHGGPLDTGDGPVELLDPAASRAYVITLPPAGTQLLAEMAELLDSQPDLMGRDQITMPHPTGCTWVHRG